MRVRPARILLSVLGLALLLPATAAAGVASADLSVTKEDTPDPVTPGSNLTYTITVTNNGPAPADAAGGAALLRRRAWRG